MQIFPTEKKHISFSLNNKEAFRLSLKKMTAPPLSSTITKQNFKFIGLITRNKFYLQVFTRLWRNPFRPLIIGKINSDSIDIKLGVNPKIFLFLIIGLFMIGWGIIQNNEFAFVIPMVIFPLFWYMIAWFFYLQDLPKTFEAVKQLEKMAETKNNP